MSDFLSSTKSLQKKIRQQNFEEKSGKRKVLIYTVRKANTIHPFGPITIVLTKSPLILLLKKTLKEKLRWMRNSERNLSVFAGLLLSFLLMNCSYKAVRYSNKRNILPSYNHLTDSTLQLTGISADPDFGFY